MSLQCGERGQDTFEKTEQQSLVFYRYVEWKLTKSRGLERVEDEGKAFHLVEQMVKQTESTYLKRVQKLHKRILKKNSFESVQSEDGAEQEEKIRAVRTG